MPYFASFIFILEVGKESELSYICIRLIISPKKGETEKMFDLRSKVEYLVVVISEFGRQHGCTFQEAYRYLKQYKGIEFLNGSYEVEHLFSIEDAVEDLTEYCYRRGGTIV